MLTGVCVVHRGGGRGLSDNTTTARLSNAALLAEVARPKGVDTPGAL